MTDRAFTFIATLALLVLMGGWAWVMVNQDERQAPGFICDPGSTYTLEGCP